MALQSVSLSGNGTTASIAMPMKNYLFTGQEGMSLLVNFSSGASATATVQVSNDPNANPQNPIATQNLARWNNHDTLNNLTGSKNSSVVFPVYAVRLQVSGYSSGTISLDLGLPDYYL
jgi:hypothetical protein